MSNTTLNILGLKGVEEMNKNASGAFICALHNNLSDDWLFERERKRDMRNSLIEQHTSNSILIFTRMRAAE
jgi:hypothetical protein